MYEIGIFIFHASLVAYLVSLGYFVMYAFHGRQVLAKRGLWLTLSGFAIHGLSIVVVSLGQQMLPWLNSLQNISFWCWGVVGISIAVSHGSRLRILGLFVLPLVIVLLFLAMVGQKDSSGHLTGFGGSGWAVVHIGLVFVAYASFAFAAVTGFMYILQSRCLKGKEGGELCDLLPSLVLLDRLNFRALTAGLFFLTIGLVLGFLWFYTLSDRPESLDPKIIVSLITWVAYTVLFLIRATSAVRGRKIAWLSIVGIGAVVLSFIFVPHSIPTKMKTTPSGSEKTSARSCVLNERIASRNPPIMGGVRLVG
jgi:ABC-type transport system involved in cytochrome c biogenesis permease subunit